MKNSRMGRREFINYSAAGIALAGSSAAGVNAESVSMS